MTDKELRRLNRNDLLEILIEQQERIETLEEENDRLREELRAKRLTQQNAGSIAEAAMALNGVFEAAQRAADQYLQNVRALPQAEAPRQAEPAAVQAAEVEAGSARRRRRA